MWIVVIVAIVVYFLFFHEEPKKKRSGSRKNTSTRARQNSKTDIPGINWVFQRKIDEPGVPAIVNTYRKSLNGKSFTEIVKMVYVATEVEKDQMQSSLIIMQLSEPLVELQALKYLEWEDVQYTQKACFEFLIMHFSTVAAIGQLRNISDLYYFLNREIPIFEGDLIRAINYAENEAEFRLALMAKLKTQEFVYKKDLKLIKGFDKIESGIHNLIGKLVSINQIEPDKKGRYIIYKLKEK